MAVKILITGATGYVGGTVYDYLQKAHPEWEYTLFVRSEERSRNIKAQYPNSRFIYGNLENSAIIEKAAAEADVVVHTADSADHVGSANAIAKGLNEGHTAEKPGYWIHLSGGSVLSWYDGLEERDGEAPVAAQTYSDVDGVDRVVNIPDVSPHRNVDIIAQSIASDVVRLAIVCPPTIYDTGSGAENRRSVQAPLLVQTTLRKGYAPIIGAGKTEWDNINIHDLADLYVKLVEATQDTSKNGNPEIFGPKAYYFAENGIHLWSDLAKSIAEEASKKGYLPANITKTITVSEANTYEGLAARSWGMNSRGIAQRANKYLGWEPKGRPLEDTISELVAIEAEHMGLKPKGDES